MSKKDEWQKLIDARKVAEYWMKRYIEAEERLEQYEWVSVNDRLPEEDGCYLVYIVANFCPENKQIITLYFSKLSNRFIYGSDEIFTVTHWMPLPEAPEREDDAE